MENQVGAWKPLATQKVDAEIGWRKNDLRKNSSGSASARGCASGRASASGSRLSVCFSNTGHYVTLLAQALVSRYMLTKSGSSSS
eukprot:SAG11_NODE_8418_length_1017_cov_4.928105_2_plen_84_part_01